MLPSRWDARTAMRSAGYPTGSGRLIGLDVGGPVHTDFDRAGGVGLPRAGESHIQRAFPTTVLSSAMIMMAVP